MARKTSGSDSVRTETLTIRLPPASRWAVELLARIEDTSLAGLIQKAVDERIWRVISGLKERAEMTDDDIWERQAHVLEDAISHKNALPHDRVLALAAEAPALLTRPEAQTLRLLQDLGVIRGFELHEDEGPMRGKFDFNPLVLRVMWQHAESAALAETLSIDDVRALKTLQAEAEALCGGL